MTGDCHVRFYESQGLQRPWPLTKSKGAKHESKAKRVKTKGKAKKGR